MSFQEMPRVWVDVVERTDLHIKLFAYDNFPIEVVYTPVSTFYTRIDERIGFDIPPLF